MRLFFNSPLIPQNIETEIESYYKPIFLNSFCFDRRNINSTNSQKKASSLHMWTFPRLESHQSTVLLRLQKSNQSQQTCVSQTVNQCARNFTSVPTARQRSLSENICGVSSLVTNYIFGNDRPRVGGLAPVPPQKSRAYALAREHINPLIQTR